jgi:hypothetical protein
MTGCRLILALALATGAACANDGAEPTAAPPRPVVATKLPTLRIETTGAAAISSKESYVPATFVLRDTRDAERQLGAL